MNLESILADIRNKASKQDPIGATLKLKVDDHILYLDGTGDSNIISQEDKDADCLVSISMNTMQKLVAGDINPMMAVMTGKIKIKGDMGVAMKIQSLL